MHYQQEVRESESKGEGDRKSSKRKRDDDKDSIRVQANEDFSSSKVSSLAHLPDMDIDDKFPADTSLARLDLEEEEHVLTSNLGVGYTEEECMINIMDVQVSRRVFLHCYH